MLPALIDNDPFFDDHRPNSIPLWDHLGGEGVTAAETLSGAGGAGQASVAPSHPLLMGRSEQGHGAGSSRAQARTLSRQRGFRYIQLNPRTGGSHGSTQILQQLLGTAGTRDFLGQLTEGTGSTRLLVMDQGFAIVDSDEFPGFDGPMGQSNNSALGNVPNALVRWTEESRVIDGDSLHDCMTTCKPDILDVIEKHREEELAERREKRKKVLEEEEAVRKVEEEERRKREPEMATTPAPEAAGHTGTGSADEMDVVVSENSAVVTAAVDSISDSLTESANRLAADLATAISSRVTGIPGGGGNNATETPTIAELAELTARRDALRAEANRSQQLLQSGISALQDLLPGQMPPTSLSSVLQSLSQGGYPAGAVTSSAAADSVPSSIDITTSSSTASSESIVSPSFQFSTPPPLFPTLPVSTDAPVSMSVDSDTPQQSAANTLPDALGPLSPSPDQQPAQDNADDFGDVTMTEENEAESEEQPTTEAPTTEETTEDNVTEPTADQHGAVVAPADNAAGNSGTATVREPDYSAILGDIEIPEGVDPSFLAALPEDMRQEVIEEQRRLVRARQQPPAQPAAAPAAGGQGAGQGAVQEVNPEFLAALPPNIQEEVLAQQRMEQMRQRQAQADPTEAVNAGEFFQTLPPSLRQSLLAEMEESQISALPADMAAEAQNLRQDRELRSRQLIHERFFNQVSSGPNLSSILRNTVSRFGSHYTLNTASGRSIYRSIGGGRGGVLGGHTQAVPSLSSANQKFRGRQLLDHEGLSCLLILLFIDDSKLNTTRLHRILRNLCYHAPTRDWVVRCLLSILEKANTVSPLTNESSPALDTTPTPAKMRKSGSGKSETKETLSRGQASSWLNISMDAALGFRANVFQVQRSQGTGGKKSNASTLASIAVHPQAAPVVCRHTLEVLIFLARAFPIHFLPNTSNSDTSSSTSGSSDKKTGKSAEFWDTLLKLDKECWSSKKGKSVVRSHSSVSIKSEDEDASSASLTFSAFGQLLSMLASPTIKRSSLLTDKLLRLLSLISLGQPTSENILKRIDADLGLGAARTDNVATAAAGSSSEQSPLVDKVIRDDQIQLAVEVLTSKACSEEGLEDVTALLLNLSYGGHKTRDSILHLLLAGARQLGNVVCTHVSDLLKELQDLKTAGNLQHSGKETEDEESKSKGTLADRFTKEAVVLTAPSKPKGGGELQLGSMVALTNKTSSQSFFLRVLKVIIQLREAALQAIKKAQKQREAEAKKKEAEAAAEAAKKAMELLRGESDATKEPSTDEAEPAKDDTVAPGTEPESKEESDSTNNQAPSQEEAAKENDQGLSSSSPMEVESPVTTPESLESLSEQLDLSQLWSTLSNCLKELADTPDHHAVLVLQPTVEAFFLVHAAATTNEDKKKPSQKESRKEQLSHIDEREGSLDSDKKAAEEASNAEADMSADTKKFLSFAETHRTVLNQILRQSTTHLADGPFSVLVDHTRVLDFDIKRQYFRTELERLDEGIRLMHTLSGTICNNYFVGERTWLFMLTETLCLRNPSESYKEDLLRSGRTDSTSSLKVKRVKMLAAC